MAVAQLINGIVHDFKSPGIEKKKKETEKINKKASDNKV